MNARRKPREKSKVEFIHILDTIVRISEISRVVAWNGGTDYSNQMRYMISVFLINGTKLDFRYFDYHVRKIEFNGIKRTLGIKN
jgi:hypothetical protein